VPPEEEPEGRKKKLVQTGNKIFRFEAKKLEKKHHYPALSCREKDQGDAHRLALSQA